MCGRNYPPPLLREGAEAWWYGIHNRLVYTFQSPENDELDIVPPWFWTE